MESGFLRRQVDWRDARLECETGYSTFQHNCICSWLCDGGGGGCVNGEEQRPGTRAGRAEGSVRDSMSLYPLQEVMRESPLISTATISCLSWLVGCAPPSYTTSSSFSPHIFPHLYTLIPPPTGAI
ncbi:hypothetical protein E2C01_097648 [Portunus trituberculatus]|uniref:Uncharacterized protein n=1 Tax=Portunus trituberculatus TaxID=210409 RepID=A0A5B7K4Z3_PORTR|nr:hypothetical protein [Portunus trituberculatus]